MNPATEELLAELVGDEALEIMSHFDLQREYDDDWLVNSLTKFQDDCNAARQDSCALRAELERLRDLVCEIDAESIDRVLAEDEKAKK